MGVSCPGVRRDWPGNDDNVDGAGEILVVVKFADAMGIIGGAEGNDWRNSLEGVSMKENQGFQSR